MVKKRALFFIGGFDPKSPEAFFRRMDREIERFQALWNVEVVAETPQQVDADVTCRRFVCSGLDDCGEWSTATDFHFLSLDDIVLRDFAQPLHFRIWRYIATFADFVSSGTAFGFVRHGWRFSLYFFYPAVMLLLCVLAGLAVAWLMVDLEPPFPTFLSLLAFVLTVMAVHRWVLTRYHVPHLMDLWSFSRDYLHNRHSTMNGKLDRLADHISRAASSNEYDEVVTIGHSTGGALILDAAARAHERNQDFSTASPKVCIATVGSTALKVGLHPAADWYRDRLKKLFDESSTRWVEVQCLTDIINFYRTHPGNLMGLVEGSEHTPEVFAIRIKKMVSRDVYARIKLNFFRVHYQFVFGNTVRAVYDFPALCFGPSRWLDRLRSSRTSRKSNPYLHSLTGSGSSNVE